MYEYRTRISNDGRIVIPSVCREQLHLKPGEELIIEIENDEIGIHSMKQILKKAQKLVQKHAKGRNLVDELIKERREAAKDEYRTRTRNG